MNTNLIMGLLIQLVTALKEPTPPASGSYSNLIGWSPPFTNTYQGPMALWANRTFTLIGGEIPTKTVTQFTDEAIRELAKSGRICEVLGHRWEGGRRGEGPFNTFADYHPGMTFRHCTICGAGQTKAEGDWK